MIKLSPSKIEIYKQCPKRYKLHYVDKLIRKYKKDWPHISYGDSVHAALRDFFRIPPAVRSYELLEKIYRRNWVRKGFKSREEEAEWGRRGLEALRRFYETEDWAKSPICVEKNFEAKYPEVILMGRIDRVDQTPDGGLHIIDYKTGRRGDKEKLDESLALSLYQIVVERRLRRPVTKITLHYLDTGEKITTVRKPEQLRDHFEELARLSQEMEMRSSYPPKPGKFCKWCDFLEICSEGSDKIC